MLWKKSSTHGKYSGVNFEYLHGCEGCSGTDRCFDHERKVEVCNNPVINISIIEKPYMLTIELYDLERFTSTDYVEIDYSLFRGEDIWSAFEDVEKYKLLPMVTLKKIFDSLGKHLLERPRAKTLGSVNLEFNDMDNEGWYSSGPLPKEMIVPLLSVIPIVKSGECPDFFPHFNYVSESEFVQQYKALYDELRKWIIKEGEHYSFEEDGERESAFL